MDSSFPNSIIQKIQSENYRPVIRILVIVSVLILTIASTFIEDQIISLLIIGLIIGIGGLLVLLRYPGLGIVAIIPGSFIAPFAIDVSSGTSINATVLLIFLMTIIWAFDMVVQQRQIKFISSRVIRPLFIFLVVALLSFAVGQLPFFVFANKAPITAQLGGLAIFFLSALAFLLAAHYMKTVAWLKGLTWVFIFIGTGFLITQLVPGMSRTGLSIYNQGSLSSLFWLLMVGLAASQALFNDQLEIKWRLVLLFISILTLYISYVVVPGWKSGWVPAVITLVVLLMLRSKHIALIIIIVGIVATPFVVQDLLATEEYSYATRIEAWALIGEMVKVNPILGLGPANYYYYTPLFPIRGYAVQFNSHNQFIDIIAQTGILGLLAFLWFLMELGLLGLQLQKSMRDGFPKAFVYGMLASLVGIIVSAMLGDWFLPFIYNIGYIGFQGSVFGWLFLGGLVALEQMTLKNADQ